uniref:Uncharacterized protein n=1 Tax=Timema monikensis TaxID=170555 RepID=A0A7R9EJJ6_9NEOP|nr:unnamed protein product [Timema monikensis]
MEGTQLSQPSLNAAEMNCRLTVDDGCNNSVNDHVQRSWRWGELPSPIILTPESQKSSKSNDLPTHQGFEMEDQPKQGSSDGSREAYIQAQGWKPKRRT